MEIQNYPNYLIYPDGRVWSQKRKRYLLYDTSSGYHRVSISNNSTLKRFLVHRLVAIHYIPNPHDYPQVDHIDRDKTNNDVSNLRWVTPLQNQRNQGQYITNTSGIKNVYYYVHKNKDKWRYAKYYNYKKHTLTFENKQLCLWCKFIYELMIS